MSSKAVAVIEKKFGMKAKVKPGKVYAEMDRAKPSNTMHIFLEMKSGEVEQIHHNLITAPGLDMSEVETVMFVYTGPTWLTVNTYPALKVMMSGNDQVFTPEQKAKGNTYAQLTGRKKHSGDRVREAREKAEGTIVEPAEDEDVDVPW